MPALCCAGVQMVDPYLLISVSDHKVYSLLLRPYAVPAQFCELCCMRAIPLKQVNCGGVLPWCEGHMICLVRRGKLVLAVQHKLSPLPPATPPLLRFLLAG